MTQRLRLPHKYRGLGSLAGVAGVLYLLRYALPSHSNYPTLRTLINTSPTIPDGVLWSLNRPLDTEEAYDMAYVTVGEPMQQIYLAKESIQDHEGTVGGSFNPAILRMPAGLPWGFLVVTRGPRRPRPEMWVKVADHAAEEQNLVAFGANYSPEGAFIPASAAILLPISTNIADACGGWAWPYGAEDPRLQWSDDGRPMLTFVRPSTIPDVCRDIAMAEDLRGLWPELREMLQGGVGGVLEFDASRAKVTEVTFPGRGVVEKGWMPFFPGPIRDPTRLLPNFHFKLVPRTILAPNPSSLSYQIKGEQHVIHYKAIQNPDPTPNCVHSYHPNSHADGIHHASPLYRLTMCERGKCVPTIENTAFVALNNINRRRGEDIRYGRFFSLWNVTEPFQYIAVGPEISFAGVESFHFAYGMSLTFIPRRYNPKKDDKATKQYGLGHGFIDDDVIISIGLDDDAMGTVRMPAQDILIHMLLCEGTPGESDDGA